MDRAPRQYHGPEAHVTLGPINDVDGQTGALGATCRREAAEWDAAERPGEPLFVVGRIRSYSPTAIEFVTPRTSGAESASRSAQDFE